MVSQRASVSRPTPALVPALALLLCSSTLLATGCGGDEPARSPDGSSADTGGASQGGSRPAGPAGGAGSTRGRGEVAPATRTGEEAYDSGELGALYGQILFDGEPPLRFDLGAADAKECQHHPEVDQRSNRIVVEDGKLANVFVYLRSGYDEARIPAPPDMAVHLDQRGCMYVPRVLGVQVGQPLEIGNADPTTHNVHSKPRRNPEENRSMGAEQPPLSFRFERPELPVPFKCDIHPWMEASVYVAEHPWFAVSDAQGRFRIVDVPPGEYVVEALHDNLGKRAGSVMVQAGKATGISFTFTE